MRQGSNNQSNRRGRGRGHNHSRRNNHNNRNQTFDSNGPSGRIRGNAKQIHEKYLQLAKDAISSGDRVLAESLFQHADHYGRIAAQFAPKPKPEVEEAPEAAENAETSTEEASETEAEVVKVEIENADETGEQPSLDLTNEEEASDTVAEEKPKRRTTTRRAPRKKADADAPKLGGGTNAVPDFLARPVEVDSEEKEAEDTEEKPKRRTRRTSTTTRKTTTTRTRRKKAEEPEEASGEAEVV